MAQSAQQPTNTLLKLLQLLEKGEIDPVYVLGGPESFLIERALVLLRERVLRDQDEMAYVALQADETDGRTVVGTARTVPLFASRQLVVLRHAEALKADQLNLLLPYLASPTPTTCLVVVTQRIDRKFKFFDVAERQGVTWHAAPLAPRELPGWIAHRAQTQGLQLTTDAVQLLIETAGADLATLEDALERLTLFAEGGRVGAADVAALVSTSRTHSVFELTDALGRKEIAGALRTLRRMLAQGEAALRLLATLDTHLRRLLVAADLGATAQQSPLQLANKMGVTPFVAQKLAAQARHFSTSELRRALLRLAQTDIELKSARRPDELILEQMLLEICLPPPQQAARAARAQRPV